jgi:general stress protein YciG
MLHGEVASMDERYESDYPVPYVPTLKGLRGFARLTAEERRSISRRGGQAAHAQGLAHEYTSETARAAGRKGGLACAAAKRAAMSPAEVAKSLDRALRTARE